MFFPLFARPKNTEYFNVICHCFCCEYKIMKKKLFLRKSVNF